MKPIIQTVICLLTASGGRRLKQTQLEAGTTKYCEGKEEYSSDEVERSAYALQAMVGQLCNHSKKDLFQSINNLYLYIYIYLFIYLYIYIYIL